MPDCPVCETDVQAKEDILVCGNCGHRWMHGTSGEALGLYTQHYDGYRFDPTFAASVRSYIRTELVPRVPAPARVLDVGCGAGEFLLGAADAGYDAQGIDISKAAAAMAQERGGRARAANYLTEDVGQDYDIITMWDVMEHLPDPSGFLARTAQLLRPEGMLVAKIPYFGDLSVNLSRRFARLRGALLGAPDHIQFYTRESLQHLLARHGFRIESLEIGGGMREPTRKAWSLRRAISQGTIRTAKRLSGDGNFYLIAYAKGRESAAAAQKTPQPGSGRLQ